MSIFDPINRTFGGFNQKVSGLGLPGGLGSCKLALIY